MRKRRHIRATIALGACAIWLAPLAAAEAGALGAGGGFEPPLIRLIVGFILCAILALLAALVLKRFIANGGKLPSGIDMFSAPAREIIVHETHRISAAADVCRLSWRDREYLIAVAGTGVTILAERAHPEAPST